MCTMISSIELLNKKGTTTTRTYLAVDKFKIVQKVLHTIATLL